MIQTNRTGSRIDGRDANDERWAAHVSLGPAGDDATHITLRHDGLALLAPREAEALARWILTTLEVTR